MGLFIQVEIDKALCQAQPGKCLECVLICPVDIFSELGGQLVVVAEREDECLLCELCLDAAPPGAIRIIKHYADEMLTRTAGALERAQTGRPH
jgi:NAD-dependent dihydropyrimidine dehydrogenase PreA subunit